MSSPYREAAPELGALLGTHKERGALVFTFVFGGLSTVIFASITFTRFPPLTAILLVMLMVIVIGAGVLSELRKRSGRTDIQRFERGIVAHARQGIRTIRYDDVKCITSVTTHRKSTGIEQQMHIVEAKDGTKIGFTLIYDNALDLLRVIDAATHDRLHAEALAAYDAGEISKFGPIAVSEDGLFDRDRAVTPWGEIDRAVIASPRGDRGVSWSEIKVWKKGASDAFLAYSTERIPNATVLVEVITRATEVDADEASD